MSRLKAGDSFTKEAMVGKVLAKIQGRSVMAIVVFTAMIAEGVSRFTIELDTMELGFASWCFSLVQRGTSVSLF